MLMIGVNLRHSNLLFIPHSRRWGDSLTHSQNTTCPMISNEVESSTCSRQTPFYHLSGPRFISHSLLSSSIISHSIEALSHRVAPPPPTFVGVSRVWKKKIQRWMEMEASSAAHQLLFSRQKDDGATSRDVSYLHRKTIRPALPTRFKNKSSRNIFIVFCDFWPSVHLSQLSVTFWHTLSYKGQSSQICCQLFFVLCW